MTKNLTSSQKYYIKNKDKVLARTSAYAKENRERTNAYGRKYYHKNRNKRLLSYKNWVKVNRDKRHKINKRYYEANKSSIIKQMSNIRKANKEYRHAWFRGLLGGKCSVCGGLIRLNYHHENPKEKEFTIGRLIGSLPLERLLRELSKCVLLCPRHHARAHKRLRDEAIL